MKNTSKVNISITGYFTERRFLIQALSQLGILLGGNHPIRSDDDLPDAVTVNNNVGESELFVVFGDYDEDREVIPNMEISSELIEKLRVNEEGIIYRV